jgi:hypothetical protein
VRGRSVAAAGIGTQRSSMRLGIETTGRRAIVLWLGAIKQEELHEARKLAERRQRERCTAGTAGDRCERVRLRGCAGAATPPHRKILAP